jgi:nucleoside-diphosphate-sugar epimerase
MRLLITGATGFVGSHLAEALAGRKTPEAPTVRILARPNSDLSRLDGLDLERATGSLGDPTSLVKAAGDVDVVLHLAGLTRARNSDEFRGVNENGTRNLLQAATESGTCRRFVYVSSLAAVGPAVPGSPVDRNTVPHPLTAYGRSKLAGERVLDEAPNSMEVVILRPPAVYGPRDRDLLSFFALATWGLLPVPTGPQRHLQLIHVTDLAEAIAVAGSQAGVRGIYHVAHREAHTWAQVLELIAKAVGRKGRKIPLPQTLMKLAGGVNGILGRALRRPQIFDSDKVRELLAPGWLCETERAREDLGFEARISLGEGLKQTAAWYRKEGWLR